MKEWVISLIVSVFTFSIIALLLPNGSTAKYIKQLFSVIMIFVLLQPLLNKELFDAESLVFNDDIAFVQNDFLDYAHDKNVLNFKENINKILSN